MGLRLRSSTAVLVLTGMAVLGLPALGASAATAPAVVGTSRSTPALGASAAHIMKRSLQPAETARISGFAQGHPLAPASVSPVSPYLPGCYGDSRVVPPQSEPMVPASFGAFYNCSSNEWTFEIQTLGFTTSGFGNFAALINVDGDTSGSQSDNCEGTDYVLQVFQLPTAESRPSGQFETEMTVYDGSCTNYSILRGFPFTINNSTSTATVSVPASDFDEPVDSSTEANSFAWYGLVQDFTQWDTGKGYALFPSSSYVDSNLIGGVIESVPATEPNPNCAADASDNQAATTNNATAAVAALKKAGLADVKSTGFGVVSFSGSEAVAERAMTAAGISAQVSPSQTFRPAGSIVDSATRAASTDPALPSQWNLQKINAAGAWGVTTGTEIKVADIDTGADYTNPDLTPVLLNGFDENTQVAIGPGTSESGNTDPVTDPDGGHGTAVAGVIAAANNGTELAALGWNTEVIPVKVDFEATNADTQIASGIDWAVDNGAKVINLSFGGPCPDQVIQTAIQSAQSSGVLVVAAAGNEAIYPEFETTIGVTSPDYPQGDQPSYPAAYDQTSGISNVIAVGATGEDGYRAGYSNTGSYVSLVAPGGNYDYMNAQNQTVTDSFPLLSTTDAPSCTSGPGVYCTTTGIGTSFASPEVAATAALILSVNPNLSPSQVAELIEGTATDQGVPGVDQEYGAGLLNAAEAVEDTPPTTADFGQYVPVTPDRILDTRGGLGAPKGQVGQGKSITLQVAGAPGSGIPSSGVSAVVLNVTVANPTAAGYVTVWPAGDPLPNASNINFQAGQTVPNLVTVALGTGGGVGLANAFGSVSLIADVQGYYLSGPPPEEVQGSTFMPLAPDRLLDTRPSEGGRGPVVAGSPISLTVGGVDTVPADASAAVLNVTVTQPDATSDLAVYPVGSTPNVSNLNFTKNQTVPNLVIVKLGTGGAIQIANDAGSTDVVVDLEGYFTAPGDASGSVFFPLVDHRVLDTRANVGSNVNGGSFFGPIAPNSTDDVGFIGQGGVISGASAVVMNTTVTGATAGSDLTIYPGGGSRPNSSDLNFSRGQTVANLVTVELGTNGDADIYNLAGSVNVIADIAGWYEAPSG